MIKSSPSSESISKLLDEILNDSDELIKSLPGKLKKFDVLSISLFFTLIEITTDVNYLVKVKRFISIPSLVRSFMDTHVDLLLITGDSENVYPLLYKVYDGERKVLKAKIDPLHSSLFITDSNDLETIKKQIIEKDKEIIELEKLVGSNKLRTIKDKYERVNLLWFYKTIYNDLCAHTHNALNSIEHRHIDQVPDDKILLRYLQSNDSKDFYKYILTLLTHFYSSVEVINSALDLRQDFIVERIQKRINEIINPT